MYIIKYLNENIRTLTYVVYNTTDDRKKKMINKKKKKCIRRPPRAEWVLESNEKKGACPVVSRRQLYAKKDRVHPYAYARAPAHTV